MKTSKKFTSAHMKQFCSTKFGYNFEVGIWFPSTESEEIYKYNAYITGLVSQSQKIASGEFPLIIISSGYAGTMYDQCYLAEEMARNGYVVVSVSHSKLDVGSLLGCGRAWYRSYEIKCAMDSIISHNYFALIFL